MRQVCLKKLTLSCWTNYFFFFWKFALTSKNWSRLLKLEKKKIAKLCKNPLINKKTDDNNLLDQRPHILGPVFESDSHKTWTRTNKTYCKHKIIFWKKNIYFWAEFCLFARGGFAKARRALSVAKIKYFTYLLWAPIFPQLLVYFYNNFMWLSFVCLFVQYFFASNDFKAWFFFVNFFHTLK